MYQTVEFITLLLIGLAGVVLTFITLPGTWIIIAIALVLAFIAKMTGWQSGLSLWFIAVAVALAVVGEVVEFFAGAAGAKRGGAGRPGAIGAIVGGLTGAVIATPVLPIIGTFLGAVVGAGIGAAIAERGFAEKSWKDSASIALGAAGGRLVATIAKTAIAALIALLLIVDSNPWFELF